MLLMLIGSVLLFDFLNGFHDSAKLLATLIASRALAARPALLLTAAAMLTGPFLFGSAIARTVGRGLVLPDAATLPVFLAAVWGATTWALVTWYTGMPSSRAHALVGAILGSAAVSSGLGSLQWAGMRTVYAALLLSPLLGLLIGYLLMKLVLELAQAASPSINLWFKRAQRFTFMGLALTHGSNSAQNSMGIITLGLSVSGLVQGFAVPLWVVAASATATAAGMLTGGGSLMRTLGSGMCTVRQVLGFVSQVAAAVVILGAALTGGPVSTTHVNGAAIMGVGAAQNARRVRWGVASEILWTWLLTIPLSALLAGIFSLLLRQTGMK
ncbi:MAG: inorganic phosphate transporter [Chloroflexi bacterium]|nr:MAG: inorganic phosphate transporter [Chloroflexota bacterium]